MTRYVPLPMLLSDHHELVGEHILYVYPARHNSLRLDLVRRRMKTLGVPRRQKLVGSITVPISWLDRIASGEYHERWDGVFAEREDSCE